MEAILLVVEKVGILFVMIAVGFACTKAGMLTHKGIAEITAFLLRIVTPCLIVSSFLSADSGVELPVLGFSVLTAVLAHLLAILLSLLTFRKTEPDRQKTLRFFPIPDLWACRWCSRLWATVAWCMLRFISPFSICSAGHTAIP